jgi:hypothetical protein
MFTADDVQSRLHERPFTPFRILTTTGETYDIYHPDLVLVARRFLIIGLPSTENPAQAEQVTRLAMLHAAELRDLPLPAAPPSNGPA